MLARINSAAAGIVDYLETGRKKGREFDRDLIDERLPLAGDIELLDAVIDGIQTQQAGDARYLHITLGFAEQFTAAEECGPGQINAKVLHEVVEAYRQAVMAAYDSSEYMFYAEAHIPKVTHELNARSGDYESRLPHVHIIIPMRNLESDRYLNPFGYGAATEWAAQAIQEQINRQFGLRSPRQARRDPATPVHPLGRHEASFEGQSPKQIRAYLTGLVASRSVVTFEQLAEAARVIGVVTVRQGKDGDYINVKPDWADKGINIKDLGRPKFDLKATALREPGPAPDFDNDVARWREQGAFEARYVASPRMRKAYKAMSPAERDEFLNARRAETRARLAVYDEPIARQLVRAAGEAIDRALAKVEKQGIPIPRPVGYADRVKTLIKELRSDRPDRTLSAGADGDRGNQVPLTPKERLDLAAAAIARRVEQAKDREKIRAWLERRNFGKALETLLRRWTADRLEHRKSQTVIEAIAASARQTPPAPDRLKADTNPAIVLTAAQRLYGIDPAAYSIGTGADGSPRIIHQDKQYNLGDFFTKHLQRPWTEAEGVLKDCYHASLSDALPPPDPVLWRQFSQWRSRQLAEVAGRRRSNSVGFRARVLETREGYQRRKADAQCLPAPMRAEALARARADQFIAQQEIAAERAKASIDARVPHRNAHYREFLVELATSGDTAALTELRRMAPHQEDPGPKISGGRSQAVFPLPSYTVDAKGAVTYRMKSEAIVRDAAQGVTVLKADTPAYDAAIRVAIARYGRTLTLNGDPRFIANITEAARRTGLELTLRDSSRMHAMPVVLRARGRAAPEPER